MAGLPNIFCLCEECALLLCYDAQTHTAKVTKKNAVCNGVRMFLFLSTLQ